MKKDKKEKRSIVPTLIAGLTATAIGIATYSMFKTDRVQKRAERPEAKKKDERLFI